MLNWLQKLQDWFFADISNRMASLEQQVTRLEKDVGDIKEEKKSKWKLDWIAVGAIGTCLGAITTVVITYFALKQAENATRQAAMAEIVQRQQAFSRVKIGFYEGKGYHAFIFANSGINPIQNGKKAMLLIELPSGERPTIKRQFLPIDSLDSDDPKSISFNVPPPSGTNLFAFAVFQGTQEFLGEKRTIAKAKMVYRFGAQWFEAPETFVTTGKCEKEIIGLREQPILWEQLQQLRRANENRNLDNP